VQSPSLRPAAGILASVLLALGGCAAMPSAGPTAAAVEASRREGTGIEMHDIAGDVAPTPVAPAAPAAPGELSRLAKAGVVDRIGPGDVLDVTLYEVGATLFSPAAAPSTLNAMAEPGAGATSFGAVTVDRDGTVSLPYAGRLQLAGRTPAEAGQIIAQAFTRKSQAPQALVRVRENVANTVTVMGDVRKPGRLPLTLAGERVLDAVALAGGSAHAEADTLLRVTRGGQSAQMRMNRLTAGSPDDLPLLAGDRLELVYSPRTLTVFGAAGKVSEIPFETPRISLAEALARAGGPVDQMADASAVFIFRYDQADEDGAPLQGARPEIFRLNMLKAESYFLAQRFEMRPRDVLLVASASANQPTKVAQVLNLMFSPAYTVKVLTR
jgi:polysaccharide export outer membrane protein